MAIKFESDKGEKSKPAKKEVGGKVYVAEEPAPAPTEALPFGKPPRTEKKERPRR